MCWWLSSCEMYEGKNIHYSPVDNKPLCSFSQKQCHQRRLNGYAFCVRHILEDPTAPFRRCAYVAKSSQHLCTQAIPQGEQRQYCNNHMQVLGMLPRRERKPKKEKEKDHNKEKDNKDKDNLTPSADANKMTFGDRLKSKKLTLPKTAHSPLLGKVLNPVDDPDDPYAFHDAAPDVSPVANSIGQTGPSGASGGVPEMASRSPYPQSLPSPSQSRPIGEGMGIGGLSKAKLYPELAEKLEKVRPSPETKTAKARARSSRTMNKLQTKIAQNKIKDKLRKSQESNQSELSPSQVASPERMAFSAALFNSGIVGTDYGPIPGMDINSVGSRLPPLTLPGLDLPAMDSTGARGLGVGALPGPASQLLRLDHLNQGNLSSQLLSPLPPPPYPGVPVHREPHFSPSEGQVSVSSVGQTPVEKPPVTTSLSSHTPPNPYLSFSQASSLSSPMVSPAQSQAHHLHHHHHQSLHHHQPLSGQLPSLKSLASPPSVLSAPAMEKADIPFPPKNSSSVLNQSLANRQPPPVSAVSSFPQTSAILTSKHPLPKPLLSPTGSVEVQSPLDLPPPPPYVPRSHACAVPTSVTNQSAVLLRHVQRPKGVLTAKEAHAQLKSDSAVKLYGVYVLQRLNNHVYMDPCMSLCASDEEASSDEEMNDERLPHQSDWKVISDDEEDNELDEDGELPSDLRMVKLGVTRARHRRHCTQTKHATRINTKSAAAAKKFTLALIKLAKENPSTAARTLSVIHNRPLQWSQERKRRRKVIWKKVCQYKDGADRQCTVMCLPYTNHCRKHIMYNVDQQLFQFCTAKNTDNTQCCMPVIDICHDFPLCYPHALQAEQIQKEEAAEIKKRPRKKTKPPALTRPPRKGKKKKGKNVRPQKPMPPDKPVGDLGMPEIIPMEITPSVPESKPDTTPAAPIPSQPTPVVPPTPAAAAAASTSQDVSKEKIVPPATAAVPRVAKESKHLEQALGSVDLETFSPDQYFDKFEHASRFLEDPMFENFPDDAFNDILSMADKNGEPDAALVQENEKLERQIAEVTDNVFKVKDTLDKLLKGQITMEDVAEQDANKIAEAIANDLTGFGMDTVQQPEIATTTAAPVLDPYSGVPCDQAIAGMTLPVQPQSQHPQAQLAEFSPMVTVAGTSRGVVSQSVTSVASFLPPGMSTTVNGITVPGIVPQNSATYNPAVLAAFPAGYVPSSAIPQQASSVPGEAQVYPEGRLPQGYHMVQTAGQSQGHLPGFQGLQGLPSAAVLLSGAAGELSVQQQQALLTRGVSGQQMRPATASPSQQVLNRPMEVGSSTLHPQQGPSSGASLTQPGSEKLHPQAGPSSVSVHPQPGSNVLSVHPKQGLPSVSVHPQQGPSTGSVHSQQGPSTVGIHSQQTSGVVTVHPQQGLSSVSVHPQQGPSAVSLHPQKGPSTISVHPQQNSTTTGLSTQLQAQPVLAAQLANNAHTAWAQAIALQQQQQGGSSGYHSVNGFPATAPLPYTTAGVTMAHTLSSNTTLQPKFNTLPGQINSVSLAPQSTGSTTASFSTITKHDLHLGASHAAAVMVNQAPSPPVTGLKQDPRIAALAQQHSRAVGRSGSPGFRTVHSPSPTHSPQGVNQTLPPFSPALPAYQGSGTGS